LDFSSILLYGALGVFAVFLLAILIPLAFTLFNGEEEKNTNIPKTGPPPPVKKSTQFFVELDRGASGQVVVPEDEPPPAHRKPVVVDFPRYTRERYVDAPQTRSKNNQKNWENHWR
jgi:hypothetical protein